jgi:hypothetical protein
MQRRKMVEGESPKKVLLPVSLNLLRLEIFHLIITGEQIATIRHH